MEELNNLRKKDATTKSIVFSQFVNFLDLVAFRLQNAGFQVPCTDASRFGWLTQPRFAGSRGQ